MIRCLTLPQFAAAVEMARFVGTKVEFGADKDEFDTS
jgi:hypothetical protein